ncbi:MAG: 4-(cytidine 5'-diphospho)-2-C-methyl-D-erythritol kinase [Verrucomicrobia bacterium]|nr:4-(cytidine 5'-diphospho)-2-C-methyl-D-erythritol kinase [Verrucomicrobiota bacterium]
MPGISIFAPAKINLFLAVTGRRADGFHDLVSVVAPLDFGDTLRAEPAEGFSLACDDPAVPCDATNLVLKAASTFAAATADKGAIRGATFFLEKCIPMGAGLGGGSSDAVAALRALNQIAGEPLDAAQLTKLATGIGSDCALFLHSAPIVMRGRGERVTPLPAEAAARLRGRRVLIFKPAFGIATPWAYGRMAAEPATYLPAAEAEARLARWLGGPAEAEALLFNNMERVAFEKFVALPVLLEELRTRFGLAPRMSGSGSACFALLPEEADGPAIAAVIRGAWGESAFVREARLL